MPLTSVVPVTAGGPPADDRADFDSPVEPGRPTLAALLALWRDRDMAYAKNPRALDAEQIAAIRAFRKKEVADLEPGERARGWVKAHSWFPPQAGQGTGDDKPEGLRAWL